MHVVVVCSVAGPGETPEGPAPLLYLDQTEARKAEKMFFWRPHPSRPRFLRVCLTGPPPLMSDARQLEVSPFSFFKILFIKFY